MASSWLQQATVVCDIAPWANEKKPPDNSEKTPNNSEGKGEHTK